MSERFDLERVNQQSRGDGYFLLLVLLLTGIGIGALFSSSFYTASIYTGDPLYFLRKRGISLIIGVVSYGIASRLPLDWIKRYTSIFLLITISLLISTFLPGIGRTVMGGMRWINVGPLSFQPSELAKITLPLYLALMLSKNEARMHEPLNTVLPPMIMTFVIVGIVFFQNDFSTAVFLFILAALIFFVANVRWIYFLLLGLVAAPVVWMMVVSKEHRMLRILTFFYPDRDPSGTGFQILAARSALSDGGFWGSGLGSGLKKMGRLPEVHSDFLFASLGEEIGFVGILLILALFVLLAVRGYGIALGSRDRFGYYLGFGLTTSILYQAFFNIAVVGGLVPATGIPLPFFSAGESSLIVTLAMCGLIQNISRQQEKMVLGTKGLFPKNQWSGLNQSVLEGQE